MSVVCRPARVQDLEFADALVVSSINDLTERHGFGQMAVSSPPKFQLFSMEDDPDGLWVAEEGERILGFAWSWVCGNLWFLAQLFVSPDRQGRSIGNELIKRTLEHAEKSGASNRVLITFSFNTVSQGLYIRHGLLPRIPIYSVSVSREHLIGRLRGQQLDFAPLEEEASTLRRLAQADERVVGVSREKHHRYLINDNGTRGFNLYDRSDWVGYAYVDAGGHIGPLAVMESHAVAPAFRTVLHLAAESGSSRVSAFLPGASEAALNTAMEHGMRIEFPMLLMSSREFGNWVQYLPRNPGFM
ncbi:GNAT family N-acetyltransferase [Bradyrhizobium australiense]|uniref:GNAT family N-acetyltransferase n=1 Tax=Bradyrhizobium australiense TaxID=2721161 RepID=A0A7Y4GUG0_9BRAD|nr:GNAT family N-acetyltransferase [Bradyrhizobium australiense]NOJ42189.1 GNAT family N-acetyltransferase [Bradyrhizobium australiense]